ncbi:MAG: hypothetical protein IJJ26_08280, partial [Victivallales bacterium]|nr:hypothetical protein [Victivallales bacterium]
MGYRDLMLEVNLVDDSTKTIQSGEIERTISNPIMELQYGLYLYAQDKGYSMDMKVTGTQSVDVAGGDFTFEDYQKEIDAGRPVLVIITDHIMTGYGYNAETKEILFDDCYDADQRMTWDGVYDYAEEDRKLENIVTVGFFTADYDVDLAVTPIDGASEKIILAAEKNQLVSLDYCFVGTPIYLSFGASNLGTSPSASFDAYASIDEEQNILVASLSLEAGAKSNLQNVS